MSVRVMNSGGPEGSVYVHGISNLPLTDSPEMCAGDRRFTVEEKVVVVKKEIINEGNNKKRHVMMSSSSSTSSIGKNSDVSGESIVKSGESEEVQSPFKGPLDAMEALEEVLPMRRGISRFYNGKSKSYASLGDTSSMSNIKDITKPENAYMKRRRNLLACTLAWDKNRSSPLRSNGGGISKRITTHSNGRVGALAFALSMSNNNNDINGNVVSTPTLSSRLNPFLEDTPFKGSTFSDTSSPRFRTLSAWRSFSFADLQQPGTVSANGHIDMIKPSQT